MLVVLLGVVFVVALFEAYQLVVVEEDAHRESSRGMKHDYRIMCDDGMILSTLSLPNTFDRKGCTVDQDIQGHPTAQPEAHQYYWQVHHLPGP
jgi:hypothetical protein